MARSRTTAPLSDGIGPIRSPNGFPLLGNRHLQTVLASIKLRRPFVMRRAARLLRRAENRVISCGGGVRLGGFLSTHPRGRRDLAILIHGWEGSADSTYLLSTAAALFDQGMNVFRLNLRDHGDTHHLNPGLFHSCRIREVVGAVRTIALACDHRRLFLGGFSLGGNFALRVALRAPAAGIGLERVVAVSPVLDPAHTLAALDSGLRFYHGYFMRRWQRSLRIKQRCYPHLYDLSALRDLRTLYDMTAYLIPRHSAYGDAEAYFTGYRITGPVLADLAVPCTIVASLDDPVNPAADLDRLSHSPFLERIVTARGGHCGFFADLAVQSGMEREMGALMTGASAAAPPPRQG